MGDFKKRVLDLGIKQINEKTDITASYEQIKNGKKITGFQFSFQRKDKQKAQVLRQSKQKVKSKLKGTWNTAENSMLKSLMEKYSYVTKDYVENKAEEENIDIHTMLCELISKKYSH